MNIRIDSLEVMNHHHAGMEAGSTELKRQSDQAKRLGDEKYKTHPQLNSVKGALQSLQPDQLLQVLKNTQQAMGGRGGTERVNVQDMPRLQEPKSSAAEKNSDPKRSASAEMTELLAKISQLTADASVSNLIAKLNGYNAMMSGAGDAYGELADQLEQQGEAWADANDALKDAQEKAGELSDDVDNAQSALDDAEKKLSDLESEAAKQNPVSEELQKQIDAAKAAVGDAKTALNQATTARDNFVDKTLNPAIKAEQAARSALDSTKSEAEKLIGSLTTQQQSVIEQQRKQANEQSKTLTFLMALMSQLIDKSSSEDLKATAELKQKLAEASAKDAEKKAKEYEAEVRKAEEMQKTMGCIGKILGWLIVAISTVAAVFTGGASLALAAVGLALAIGDEIGKAVTGRSFMADAMAPIMDAIVKPLMEALGKMFSAMLESFGVDKATAEKVGQILGAIAAAVVMIAAVIVGGSVVGKLASEAMKWIAKSSSTLIQRIMNSALGQMVKRISQGLGRSMGMSEVKMGVVSNRAQMAMTGTNLANAAIQIGGSIASANMMVEAEKARAQMLKDAALQALLNDMMNRAIDTFTQRMETVNQIVKSISAVADSRLQTGKYITKQMSGIAG